METLYTHPRFMDVCFKVLSKTITDRVVEVTIEWWYKGQMGVPYCIGPIENKTFTLDQWREFHELR